MFLSRATANEAANTGKPGNVLYYGAADAAPFGTDILGTAARAVRYDNSGNTNAEAKPGLIDVNESFCC